MDKIAVLYIEDEDVQRNKFFSELTKKGFAVDAAGSGHEGLTIFSQKQFDVVLCDLNMPRVDGLQVLKNIKKQNLNVPVILITGHGSIPQAVQAMKEGAYHFMVKPLEINDIEITIKQALETYRLQKKLAESEETLKMLMDYVPDIIYSLNPEGKFVSLSAASKSVLGYVPEELIGKSVFTVIHPDDQEKVRTNFEKSLKSAIDEFKTLEFRMLAKDGAVKDFEIRRRLYFQGGKVVRNIGIALDVTNRKKKALELEKTTYDLAHANIEMLAIQEKLEAQNAEKEKLLQELLQRKIELQAILDSSLNVIIMVNSTGKIVATNRQVFDHFGIEENIILNHPFQLFVDKISNLFENKKDFLSLIKERQQNPDSLAEKSFEFKAMYKRAFKINEPHFRFIAIFSVPVLDNQKKNLGQVWMFADITKIKQAEETLRRAHDELEIRVKERTKELAQVNETLRAEIAERKQAVTALKRSETQIRALLNAIPDLMFRFNQDGVYLDYHAPEGSELAIPKESIIGKTISDTLPPDLAAETRQFIEKALSTNETQIFEYQLPHQDVMHDFEARIVVCGKDEVLAIVRDITEQKKARKALQKAYDELEIRVKERTAELAKTNSALIEEIKERIQAEQTTATRLSYEEGLAACSQSLLEYDNINTALDNALLSLKDATHADHVYLFENYIDEKDELCSRPLLETCSTQSTPGIKNLSHKELQYKNGLERWKNLLEKGKLVSGKIKFFPESERSLLEIYGIVTILVIPLIVDEKWYGFIGFDNCSDEQDWDEEDIRLLKTAAQMIGSSISRKKALEALRFSEARFRSLVENAHDIIYSMKPDGTFSYLSPQFKKYTGYDEHDYIGKTFKGLIHPDDFSNSWQNWQDDAVEGIMQTDFEYRIRHKNGSVRWFVTHSTNIHDENNQIIESIGIAHDVTEMRKMLEDLEKTNKELRNAQAQLVQSEKMASLGMLVAGIAHEINTPAGAVNSMHNTLVRAIEKMKEELNKHFPEDIKKNKKLMIALNAMEDANRIIGSGTKRVTTIVRRLRSFARLDEAEIKEVDIHEGLEDTLTLIHHEIKHNIKINRVYGTIPKIACFPSRLNQVFLNLLINAKQAITEKGEITITTLFKNDRIYIKFEDTGTGIPKGILSKIFDPGFTTKGVRIGTGLGLSICYQIIQDHHGEIKVESEVGKGTTFTVILPIDLKNKMKLDSGK